MLRAMLGVLAGLVVAWLTVALFQFASVAAYPPPPGLDPRDPQQLQDLIAQAPPLASALVMAGWVLAAFDGGLVAAWIARGRAWPAPVVGLCVMAGVLATAWLVRYPTWILVPMIALPLPAARIGGALMQPRARVA